MIGDHADAQRVEQPRFAAHEHRIDQVLHEVRRRDAQQRHQHGADDRFEQHAAMQLAAGPGNGWWDCLSQRLGVAAAPRFIGRHQQQVAGPRLANSSRESFCDAAAGVGDDDRLLAGAGSRTTKCPKPSSCLDVGDGRQRGSGERLVGAFDRLGGKADSLGGLHQAQQVGADAVGAGQVAHGLQAELQAVMASDGGQRRRAAVAAVHLPDTVKSLEHESIKF